jgi:hypothetical protein
MLDFNTEFAWIRDRYQALFGHYGPRYDHILWELVAPAIEAIGLSDAPYHTLDHTLHVAKIGHILLEGKQYYEGSVSPQDWLHVMASLVCHDVGYVKGIFERDDGQRSVYYDGQNDKVCIPFTATGAALAEVHIERSKAYVELYLIHPQLDVKQIQANIEMTRFPIPHTADYQDTVSYPGLCRAADLLGHLSHPAYLKKLPALFQEFQEAGMTDGLGYATADDLKHHYPYFFWQVVYPYIKESMRFLSATVSGRRIIAHLYTNLCLAELDQPLCDVSLPDRYPQLDESVLLPWQEAGFTFT